MTGRPSEVELIATYFAPLAGPGGLGLRDDAAILAGTPGRDLVVTTDLLIAGVHFFADDPPGSIAQKALRVNLSDLAAKAAAPLGFLLGLALPDGWTTEWLAGFSAGLGDDSAAFGCPLLGGDTSRSPGPLMLSITAFGSVPEGSMVTRAGVAAGDVLYVTGTIGDAALGLKLRGGRADVEPRLDRIGPAASAYLVGRYLLPQPRLALGEALHTFAHAAMDVSDGLAGDLAKMLSLTGMTAEIAVADVPLSEAAVEVLGQEPRLVEAVLTGGDDYEIICAVAPDRADAFEAAAQAAGVPVRRIGTASPGDAPPVFRHREQGALVFAQPSFEHFGGTATGPAPERPSGVCMR